MTGLIWCTMKKRKEVKWAQCTREERAYRKAVDAEYGNKGEHFRGISVAQARNRNRYYQLLKHWCELKKATDAKT